MRGLTLTTFLTTSCWSPHLQCKHTVLATMCEEIKRSSAAEPAKKLKAKKNQTNIELNFKVAPDQCGCNCSDLVLQTYHVTFFSTANRHCSELLFVLCRRWQIGRRENHLITRGTCQIERKENYHKSLLFDSQSQTYLLRGFISAEFAQWNEDKLSSSNIPVGGVAVFRSLYKRLASWS